MMQDEVGAAVEMPRYKCHKEVWALKIKEVKVQTNDEGGGWWITPEEPGYARFGVPHDWVVKHDPKAGGYYVVYDDGYRSFSPAKAFEDGYTLLVKVKPTIDELERMLQEPDASVNINPDGSVTAAAGSLERAKVTGDPRALKPGN